MANALAPKIPPVEHWLSKAAPLAHPLIHSTYNQMKADPSVGKSRAQSKAMGNWGDSTQRDKERRGFILTWTDGTMVRCGTASIYMHLLDLIVGSHPINGPARKARTPSRPYQKGHRNARPREEAAAEI
jgi:hypothetical protein